MNKSPLIFDKVRFTRGEFDLFADIQFPESMLTVVLGPSGSGKTTMLDLAAGFLSPASGAILEGEKDVTDLPPEKRKVGVVFQDHALFPHLNVRDNVAYGPAVRGASRVRAGEIADRYLVLTQLANFAGRKPSSLSGGEKQRVSLARALAIEPDILLMDEPFSSLDAALRRNLRDEVRRIQRKTGITAVLVTHDQDEAMALADNLAVMKDGRIIQMGRPEELWKNPADLFCALFVGRTTRLSVRSVMRDKKGFVLVETDSGVVKMEESSVVPDLPATLVIRPEDMIVSDVETKGTSLSGRVTGVEYSGGYWKIRLDAGGDSNLIECNSAGGAVPGIGDTMFLQIRAGAPRLLPGSYSES